GAVAARASAHAHHLSNRPVLCLVELESGRALPRLSAPRSWPRSVAGAARRRLRRRADGEGRERLCRLAQVPGWRLAAPRGLEGPRAWSASDDETVFGARRWRTVAGVGRASARIAAGSASITAHSLGARGRARRAYLWVAPPVDHYRTGGGTGTRPSMSGRAGPVPDMTT